MQTSYVHAPFLPLGAVFLLGWDGRDKGDDLTNVKGREIRSNPNRPKRESGTVQSDFFGFDTLTLWVKRRCRTVNGVFPGLAEVLARRQRKDHRRHRPTINIA